MIPLIITGAAGKMGRMLVARSLAFKELKLVGAADVSFLGLDAGQVAGIGNLGVAISKLADIKAKDKPVLIDFTLPQATIETLGTAVKAGWNMVVGTTGFSSGQKEDIEKASKKIPIVLSPNMSVGVNLMFQLVGSTAKTLGEAYDIEILEAHHRLKKDAPSGTAVGLAEVLASSTGRKYPADFKLHREGFIGERSKKEIGMQVIRGGDIVGEHTVLYCGEGERLEIKHVATSRVPFADGALKAAVWVSRQKPGLYSMADVLGMKRYSISTFNEYGSAH